MKEYNFAEKIKILIDYGISDLYLMVKKEIFTGLYNENLGKFHISYNDLLTIVESANLPESVLNFINRSTSGAFDLRCFIVDPIYNVEIYIIIGDDLSLSDRYDNKPDGLSFHYLSNIINTTSGDGELHSEKYIVDIIVVGMLSDGMTSGKGRDDIMYHVLKHEIVHCVLDYLEDVVGVYVGEFTHDEEEFLCDFIPFYQSCSDKIVTTDATDCILNAISLFKENMDMFKTTYREKYEQFLGDIVNHYNTH